jgi:predicted ATP-grasp superfamily ATP-dependent carboligase
MSEPVKLTHEPDLQDAVLIVSWTEDTSGLSERVSAYLNRRLGNDAFGEIEPDEFFPLEGVAIENNVVQFPECKFYAGQRKDVVIFRGSPPRFDWYRFLNLVLDVALDHCHVKELYAIGGMASLASHTAPREILTNFNTTGMKDSLAGYNLNNTLNYETPTGQRPTLNSFLLWTAQRRALPAATLWVPTPFYLTAGDPRAQLRVMDFFNRKLNLCLAFDDLDEEVRQQNRLIAEARQRSPDLDQSMKKLESGESLSAEESERLAEEMEKSLRPKRT